MRPPEAPALPTDLDALLRRLRLPSFRRAAPEVLATARAQRWEPAEVLRALLTEEVAGRERSALVARRTAAGFPSGKTFATWDPTHSSIPAPTQAALRTLEWVRRRENLVVCGPSGTGKTFFLEALRLVDAAYERRSVAVSSNLHPAGFDELMPKTLATATVDRLLHHAHVCVTQGDSVRLAQATAGQGVVPLIPPPADAREVRHG
jgi:DNA replication protein DnaC